MNRIISKEPTLIEMGSENLHVTSGYVIPDVLSISRSDSKDKVRLYFVDRKEPWLVKNEDWEYASYSELGDS